MNPEIDLLMIVIGLALAVASEIHIIRHRAEREKGLRDGRDESKRRPPSA